MLGIILYRPEKPANVGNIMRSCVATNTKLIIIGPLTFKLDDSSLKRAGMDYINELDFKIYENYETFIRYFKDKKIYYLTRYSKNIYNKADFKNISDEIYIMFGRESSGISHEILKEKYEYTLRIPMAPCARSLNLSNCVAIMIYEVLSQQNFFNLATSEIIKGEDFLN